MRARLTAFSNKQLHSAGHFLQKLMVSQLAKKLLAFMDSEGILP